jgi:ribosomal protein S27AE
VKLGEAVAKWLPKGKVTDEMVEGAYRVSIANAASGGGARRPYAGALYTAELLRLELERKGGNCPKCGTPFLAVHVDTEHADFWYHKPDCACFRICAGCGRDMVMEGLVNEPDCQYCFPYGRPRVQEKKRKTRHAGGYQRDGKAAAAGDDDQGPAHGGET